MITSDSKIFKVVFAGIASIIVNLVWQNVWQITSLLDIPSHTVLNSCVRDLLMAITVFIVLSIVVKPKEECSFLGIESNFIKGFLVAIASISPLYIVFPLIGTINPDLTIPLLVRKSLLPGFIEELICRAFFWLSPLPSISIRKKVETFDYPIWSF